MKKVSYFHFLFCMRSQFSAQIKIEIAAKWQYTFCFRIRKCLLLKNEYTDLSELDRIVNMDQILNHSVIENFTNTELFGF